MDNLRKMLLAYARSNEFTTSVDFAAKKLKFYRDGSETLQDDVVKTVEFAAFCDGYQGHPHKYKGPVGTPEKSTLVSSLATLVGELFKTEELATDQQTRDVIDEMSVPAKYDIQYKRGSLYRR